jgi:hypothetical protein
MSSVSQVGEQMHRVLEERACVLARATGCVRRQRKFSGADVVQMLVFGFQQHPQASLEDLASTAEIRDVSVTDTAVDKRFTPACARLLHAIVEELTSVVVEAAQDVPIRLLRRFSAVILEDSSSIALPEELAEQWRGCGGTQEHTAAAVKLHVRWELKRGRLWGPKLTDGRTSDRNSPFNEQDREPGSLYVEDLGYFNQSRLAERHQAGAYSLTRLQAGTALYTLKGQRLYVLDVVPRRVGQMKELRVLVGARERLPMRLLMLRVPKEVADKRREDGARAMRSGASRRLVKRPCSWRTGRSW